MKRPNPKAIAYDVRTRKAASFRRVGHVFTPANMRLPAGKLSTAQLEYLLNAPDNHLIIEEIIPAAQEVAAAAPITPEEMEEVPPALPTERDEEPTYGGRRRRGRR